MCRLLLAPLFGHAAPGNLGMQSSLLNLPSRASPTRASALSPGSKGLMSTAPATALSPSPSPGKGPSSGSKIKQSSLRAFLSPGKMDGHMDPHGAPEGHRSMHESSRVKTEAAAEVHISGKIATQNANRAIRL